MIEKRLMFSIFNLVEHITRAELTGQGKTMIYTYYKESPGKSASERAREAVLRYTQNKTLPLLAEIGTRNREQLSELDHLVLKMEFEAKKIEAADGAV